MQYVKELPHSKRSLLKFTSKIFDPLGLLSPLVIRLKLLFRALCDVSCIWDEPLKDDVVNQWLQIVDKFSSLGVLRLPRFYFQPNVNPSFIEINGFCDASLQAYAAVLYMRSVYPDGSVKVEIIASKTRVALSKTLTIPRLELLGAVLLARLGNTISESLMHQYKLTY